MLLTPTDIKLINANGENMLINWAPRYTYSSVCPETICFFLEEGIYLSSTWTYTSEYKTCKRKNSEVWRPGALLPEFKLWLSLAFCMHNFEQVTQLLEEGNGNPLQYSCLENPRDGEAWWAAVYGVAQSRTRLKRLSSSSSSTQLLWDSSMWLNTYDLRTV